MGREQGWLAEHMLILGVTNPQGKKTLYRSGIPIGMRQNKLCHAYSTSRL